MTMSVINGATVGQYRDSVEDMSGAAAKAAPAVLFEGAQGAVVGGEAASNLGLEPTTWAKLGAALGLTSAALKGYLERYRYWGHGELCTDVNQPSWGDVMKQFWLEDDLFSK